MEKTESSRILDGGAAPRGRGTRYVELIWFLWQLTFWCFMAISNQVVTGAIQAAAIAELPADVNNTDVAGELDTYVDDTSSRILVVQASVKSILAIITTLCVGPYMDKIGPKFGFLITMCGLFVKYVVYLIVAYNRLDVGNLMWGEVIEGLTGSYILANAAAYAYVGGVASDGMMSFRFALIHGIIGIVAGFYQTTIFHISSAVGGTSNVLWIIMCLAIITLFVSYFCLEDVSPPQEGKPEAGCCPAVSTCCPAITNCPDTIRVFTRARPMQMNPRLVLLILFIANVFVSWITSSRMAIDISFISADPFYYSLQMVYYLLGFRSMLAGFGEFALVYFMSKCCPDYSIALVGCVGGVVSAITLAFATTAPILWTALALEFIQGAVVSMTHVTATKVVSPSEQGTIQSAFMANELCTKIFSTLTLDGIYFATLSTFPGAVWFFAAGCYAIAFIIFLISRSLLGKENPKPGSLLDNVMRLE